MKNANTVFRFSITLLLLSATVFTTSGCVRGHFEQLLDRDEAAALLKIYPKTLQKMSIKRGQP
jgi:hypothetical protein